MRFPTLARHTQPPKNHSNPTRPTSWQFKGNSKCSAKPSEITSPHLASSTTNNAHVADAAVDSIKGGNNGGGGGHNGDGYNGGDSNQNANGGGSSYNGGNQNATNGGGGYNSGGGTHGAVTTPAMTAPRTQAGNPPRQSSASTTGTTAAHMAAMWTTTTPAQHAPAQEKITNAPRHGSTPWAAQCVACPRPFFPAPSADRLHQRARPLRPSTTHPPLPSHSATTAHVFP
jgi:hypothetical protein